MARTYWGNGAPSAPRTAGFFFRHPWRTRGGVWWKTVKKCPIWIGLPERNWYFPAPQRAAAMPAYLVVRANNAAHRAVHFASASRIGSAAPISSVRESWTSVRRCTRRRDS